MQSTDDLPKRQKKVDNKTDNTDLEAKVADITNAFPPLEGEKIDVKHLYGNMFRVNYWKKTDPGNIFSNNLISRSFFIRSFTEQVGKSSRTTSKIVTEQESIDSMKV